MKEAANIHFPLRHPCFPPQRAEGSWEPRRLLYLCVLQQQHFSQEVLESVKNLWALIALLSLCLSLSFSFSHLPIKKRTVLWAKFRAICCLEHGMTLRQIYAHKKRFIILRTWWNVMPVAEMTGCGSLGTIRPAVSYMGIIYLPDFDFEILPTVYLTE